MPHAAATIIPTPGADDDRLRTEARGRHRRDGRGRGGRHRIAYNEQNLFATIFTALGLDPYAEYDLPGMPTFHRVENQAEPIRALLA